MEKRDDRARAWIGLSVENNQVCHIRIQTTAKNTWIALKNYNENDILSNKVSLMRRICSSKMSEDGNTEHHIAELRNLVQKLTDLGEKQLSESWTVAMVLSSLPRSYDTLVTALETRPETDPTLSLVQSNLVGEYQRRKEANCSGTNSNEALLKVRDKKLTCFFCYKSWEYIHSLNCISIL
ncbi:hypothetical protein Trydic_g14661 [Trypoxylus dichotomus]